VRRGHEPLKGEWSLPGGALELGETLESGISREVTEETGLIVKTLGIVEVLDRIVREPATDEEKRHRVQYHYVLIDFLCAVTGGSLQAASDALDALWVSREELNSHGIYKLAPATVAVIEKAFTMKR
jgi:ADP-ribose pyrophosphatase YjhB (NUDIX family)